MGLLDIGFAFAECAVVSKWFFIVGGGGACLEDVICNDATIMCGGQWLSDRRVCLGSARCDLPESVSVLCVTCLSFRFWGFGWYNLRELVCNFPKFFARLVREY